MSVPGEWFRRARYLLNRRRIEDDLRREMEAHREMMPAPARFGNTLLLREEAHEVWGWRWLDDLVQDARYAVRTLAVSHRTFAVTGVLMLRHQRHHRRLQRRQRLADRPLPFARAIAGGSRTGPGMPEWQSGNSGRSAASTSFDGWNEVGARARDAGGGERVMTSADGGPSSARCAGVAAGPTRWPITRRSRCRRIVHQRRRLGNPAIVGRRCASTASR
jgi:hypothetical protein